MMLGRVEKVKMESPLEKVVPMTEEKVKAETREDVMMVEHKERSNHGREDIRPGIDLSSGQKRKCEDPRPGIYEGSLEGHQKGGMSGNVASEVASVANGITLEEIDALISQAACSVAYRGVVRGRPGMTPKWSRGIQ